jgi:hypothetical protein
MCYTDTLHVFFSTAQNDLRSIWNLMREGEYISAFDEETFSVAVDEAVIAGELFNTYKHRQDMVSLLSETIRIDKEYPDIDDGNLLRVQAVTLEFFWNRHTSAYARYYARLYRHSKEVQRSFPE